MSQNDDMDWTDYFTQVTGTFHNKIDLSFDQENGRDGAGIELVVLGITGGQNEGFTDDEVVGQLGLHSQFFGTKFILPRVYSLHTNSDDNFQSDSSKPGVLQLGDFDKNSYKDGNI